MILEVPEPGAERGPPFRDELERQLERTLSADRLRYYREGVFHFDPVLTDLDARWRKLDTFGDYAQVLVLAVPPLEEAGPPQVAVELARLANDEMAEIALKHRDRIAGFAASLPLNDPDAALAEIDRAVGDLGALGAQVFSNVGGLPLDDARFEPIFGRLEAMERAAWLHPTRRAAWPDYAADSASDYGLWWSVGWPSATAPALSRLAYSVLLELHPGLRVIAHHGAGMVPHFSARLGSGPGSRQVKDSLPRPPLDYFKRIYADTALFGARHAVRCVLEFFGPGHVLFGTDMPLGPPGSVEATIADLDAAGLEPAELTAVYATNATTLLRLGAPA